MLEALGITKSTEAVYRLLLEQPQYGIDQMAAHLSLDEERVRAALTSLADLNLVLFDDEDGVEAFDPGAGFSFLVSQAEVELNRRSLQMEQAKQAISALQAGLGAGVARHEVVARLNGVDAVRRRLEEMASEAREECLSLLTGGAQLPDTMDASQPLDEQALRRGVRIRSIYQESFRNDPGTLDYVRWYCDLGGEARTVPVVPMLLVVVDRAAALVPIDPCDGRAGALEIRSPGLVHPIAMLFEKFWEAGTPFGEAPRRDRNDLSPQERELLLLLSVGCTDDVAARRLGLSLRTVRRISSELMARLGARSRFEAGVRATKEGWI